MVVVVFLLGGLLSRAFRNAGPPGEDHPAVGRPLPDLSLQGLGGAQDVAIEDLDGTITLVNFWGTWCPPCRAELPHIAKLQRQYAKHKDFRLLAVSCGPPGQPEVRDSLAKATLGYLTAQDLQHLPVHADLDGTTRRALDMALGGMTGYPTTVLLDRNRIIRAVWVGYYSGAEADMSRQVQELLASDD